MRKYCNKPGTPPRKGPRGRPGEVGGGGLQLPLSYCELGEGAVSGMERKVVRPDQRRGAEDAWGERGSATGQLPAVWCIYLGFLTDESRTGKCRTQAMLTVSLQRGGGRLLGGPPVLPPAPDLIRRPLLCHGGREAVKAASPRCTWEAGEAESKAGWFVCSARPSTIWPQSTSSLVPGGWISLQPLTRCKKKGGGGCRISARCQQPRTKEPPFLPPTPGGGSREPWGKFLSIPVSRRQAPLMPLCSSCLFSF